MSLNSRRLDRVLRVILVNSVAMTFWLPHTIRVRLLRFVGYEIGKATLLGHSIIRCTSLSIGDGSYINHNCLFDRGDIAIGDNVYISTGVTFATGGHDFGSAVKRAGADYQRPIVVDDGCWIGANVVVLSGVRIASGCVIGAGAVVIKSTSPDGVYVGIPARRIRNLS